jgi:hypothetical protein
MVNRNGSQLSNTPRWLGAARLLIPPERNLCLPRLTRLAREPATTARHENSVTQSIDPFQHSDRLSFPR